MPQLLILFVIFKVLQHSLEAWLGKVNKDYYQNNIEQKKVCNALKITPEEFSKTLNYANDKYSFSLYTEWAHLLIFIVFLAFGGFGYIESSSKQLATYFELKEIGTGVFFFAILGLLSMLYKLPFDWHHTFKLEEKHGFNRQTPKQFFIDRVKMLLLALLLSTLYSLGCSTSWKLPEIAGGCGLGES
ncbi:MAG: hypothetical protein R3B45_17625 [Bdellovibrionota bacterium]